MRFHFLSAAFPFLLFLASPLHVMPPFRLHDHRRGIPTPLKHRWGGSASRALDHIGRTQNPLVRDMHINFMEVDIFYG